MIQNLLSIDFFRKRLIASNRSRVGIGRPSTFSELEFSDLFYLMFSSVLCKQCTKWRSNRQSVDHHSVIDILHLLWS